MSALPGLTTGVENTLMVFTMAPLECTVRRLAIREPRAISTLAKGPLEIDD